MIRARLLYSLIVLGAIAAPAGAMAQDTRTRSSMPHFPQARTQAEYERQLAIYQQALVPEEAKVKIEAFHRAVDKRDRETVALSLCYPVRIMFRGKQINIEDKATFLQYFDAVFTPRFMHTLEQIDWTPSAIGAKGITIGTGQIWFNMNGCVVTINNNLYVI